MRRRTRLLVGVTLVVGLLGGVSAAQEIGPKDPGVHARSKGASPGYTLIAPLEQQYTYLVDLDGRVAKTWRTSTRPGLSQQLAAGGVLVRAGNLELRGPFAGGQ